MAYQVTKRINGHDYRYIVEAYKDPETNRRKARWRYAGAVEDGEVRQPRTRTPRRRITRDAIIAATASLLPFRDPEHITVDVIAASAGASRSAFYRRFRNQQEPVDAAIARMAEERLRALPPLDDVPRDLKEAKVMLRRWYDALSCNIPLQNMLQRMLGQRHDKKLRLRLKSSKSREAAVPLSLFLRQLNDAGFASIADPVALARTIKGINLAHLIAALLTPPEHELPLPEHEEIYQLIERAVFGA